MSGTLTINGGFNGQSGLISIPAALPASIDTMLQSYLDGVSGSIVGGTFGLDNFDAPDASSVTAGSGAAGTIEEVTNTDGSGSVTSSSLSGASYTVGSATTLLAVQAPGDVNLTGDGQTSVAIFGANSNVNYSDMNGGTTGAADFVFAAGGSDSLAFYSTTNANSSYDVAASGKDTVSLYNQGQDLVDATGAATTTVYVSQAEATVTASDSSSASVQFTQGAGGNLDFINNSTNQATIFSGNYAGGAAPNSVTAYGAAGGGYFVGGRAGNNSLVGGTGTVTLQGAGAGDFLSVSGGSSNILFAGTGNETLIGGSTSGSNLFQLGLSYTGSTGAIVANSVVSTEGSGLQAFFLGSSSSSTLTGSSATGATNLYDIIRDPATQANGGANYTITDFVPGRDILQFTDNSLAAGNSSVGSITTAPSGAAEIYLSDGTSVFLKGVSASSLVATTNANGVISIT